MAIKRFIPYPDKRLRSVCADVTEITDAVKDAWKDMFDTMYAMPGVGLGANQIGVMQRLAVVDCQDDFSGPLMMANPVILHASAQLREHEEGSPNLPGVWAKISRPRAVTVAYRDESGAVVEKDLIGIWATSVQHQIDHLNGKMYFDHLSPVKRKMLLAKAAKIAKKGSE
ncbi:peptide deformylase [Amylibacter marinus]|uniref:Peptide deformylase-like n=1 Tax=Amylibacter marinus TaxID=1475483 RepID=A0ABQ5VV01_9RHOB|nr:peptide deformylase [Amylibacter marinus]GLQ35058.1 peptide deformylase [Amylibacter marinus]